MQNQNKTIHQQQNLNSGLLPHQIQDCPSNPLSSNQQIKSSQNQKNIKFYKYLCLILFLSIAIAVIMFFTINRTPPFTCEGVTDCDGVKQQVKQYILNKYNKPNQAKPLLQTARILQGLINQTQNNANINYQFYYQKLFRAAECGNSMMSQFSQAQSQITDIQLETEEQLLTYLKMCQSFQDRGIQLTPNDLILTTCEFNVSYSQFMYSTNTNNLCQNNSKGCGGNQNVSSVLYFVNGVGYTPDVARDNMYALKSLADSNTITKFDDYQYQGRGTRRSGGFLSDIWLAYNQKVNQTGKGLSRMQSLRLIIKAMKDFVDITIGNSDEKDCLDFLLQRVSAEWANREIDYNTNADLMKIRKHLIEGKKVVIVAHSQGTLYTNLIYNGLNEEQRQSVGLVYVGAAASSMRDGSLNYVTNPWDTIINSIRALSLIDSQIQDPLPSNVQSKFFEALGHGFQGYIKTYPYILQMVGKIKENIAQPNKTLGYGPITIQLSWDQQPDLDLHIFQPSGAHVYYANKRGQIGYLDRDCTTGFGPQHYYTDCEKIIPGEYRVALNFYRGNPSTAQSKAHVQVQAGNVVFSNDYVLSNPIGSNGNVNPPYHVCVISVKDDPRSRSSYVYEIN